MLAVNQFAVQLNIKDAALAFDKINVQLCFLSDCGRQTGGLGGVISHDTIRDPHLHQFSPSSRTQNLKQMVIPRFDTCYNGLQSVETIASF